MKVLTRSHQPIDRPFSCEQVAEYLPWLLNGSLTPYEELQITEHMDGCSSCTVELTATLEAIEIFSAHVPISALVKYSEGGEPAELPRVEIEAHLHSCSECREDLEFMGGHRDNLLNFQTAKQRLFGPTGSQSWAQRLALIAAVTILSLAGLTWGLSHANHRSSVDQASVQMPISRRVVAPNVFKDGFESGSVTIWHEPATLDGFESGDLGTSWQVGTNADSPI